jgi:hypothetical protein
VCPLLGRVQPERARDVTAKKRPVVDREQRQQPLPLERDGDDLAGDRELEAPEEAEPRTRAGGRSDA